jgi:y4mF family transcriptional regulator
MDPIGMLTTLGERIRATRKNRGLTQAQVAERARVSRRSVIDVESGRETPSIGVYVRVLAALGMDLSADIARRPTLAEVRKRFDPDGA